MPGWQRIVLKISVGVVLLDLATIILVSLNSPIADLAIYLLFGLALAGIGWIAASHWMSRVIGREDLRDSHENDPAGTPTVTSLAVSTPPLEDKNWLRLVEGCVELVDELDNAQSHFDPGRRDLVGHVLARLEEILSQPGIETIKGDDTFDRERHKPNRDVETGSPIAATLSPGFAVGRRILRRARVSIPSQGESPEYEY